MSRKLIELDINGAQYKIAVRPYDVLLDVIRENLNLTGNVSDRILVMSKGKIVETLSIDQFRNEEVRIHHQWLTI